MKKVFFSVSKDSSYSDYKMSGIGYVTEVDLIAACLSKNGKPYIRVFEDCIKDCHQVSGKQDEFKGSYYEVHEYEGRDITTNYNIWFKYAD